MINIFRPDYRNFEGLRPIYIYVLRLFFVVMFAIMSYTAWPHILTNKGEWKPILTVTWFTWATYSALSLFGIYNTLKMLPIMLFTVLYQGLWLIIVAYPLWRTNTLKGSSAEELANIFIWAWIPLLFITRKYFFKNYILYNKK